MAACTLCRLAMSSSLWRICSLLGVSKAASGSWPILEASCICSMCLTFTLRGLTPTFHNLSLAGQDPASHSSPASLLYIPMLSSWQANQQHPHAELLASQSTAPHDQNCRDWKNMDEAVNIAFDGLVKPMTDLKLHVYSSMHSSEETLALLCSSSAAACNRRSSVALRCCSCCRSLAACAARPSASCLSRLAAARSSSGSQ